MALYNSRLVLFLGLFVLLVGQSHQQDGSFIEKRIQTSPSGKTSIRQPAYLPMKSTIQTNPSTTPTRASNRPTVLPYTRPTQPSNRPTLPYTRPAQPSTTPTQASNGSTLSSTSPIQPSTTPTNPTSSTPSSTTIRATNSSSQTCAHLLLVIITLMMIFAVRN